MQLDLNGNSLLKTDTCDKSNMVHLRAVYTVSHIKYEDLDCNDVSEHDALEVLLNDDALRNFLEKEYDKARESRFDEDDCDQYCRDNALENAKYFGYKIEERYV